MKVLVACVAVLALVGAASAIQCFVCNSEIDSACDDEFKFDSPALRVAFIKNCTVPHNSTEGESMIDIGDVPDVVSEGVTDAGDATEALEETADDASGIFCRKSKIYIETPKQPSTVRVYRDCGYMLRKGSKCYQKRSEDYVLDVCQCEDELCNGSNTLSFSLTPLIALTLPFFTRFL